MRFAAVVALALGLMLGIAGAQQADQGAGSAIENGSRVELEYSFVDNHGNNLGSNRGGQPLAIIQGQHEVLPALEKALLGMRVGEEKQITLSPVEAYGEADPNAVAEIPRDRIPTETLTAGMDIEFQGEDGQNRTARIKQIKEESVIVDLNHPLAGKTLVIDVKVLNVEPPAK